ncbi:MULTISPECIES: hypothetical protein [Nitrosopumilus]|uniref:Uncharacterized protein n=1 Tax=Nitrosopumilus piranensis TaxID=1582439 RepID=A0A0C5C169_9ARCH|nr:MULTISPECIES: hypothetical protein [Nitrosopumilus]AJM93075.1 hypothetical protein NPIRD3C_1865 [Nitrosopumilus piranensis]KAF6244931.1 hypothetical protein C6989_06000 [Nitrosopumilus sp. b2]
MQTDVRHDIRKLENEIVQIENKIVEFMNFRHQAEIKKSLHKLESDLKYLSILANGAPIDKREDRKVMDFLRVHYDYLQKLSVPV